ncbi:hypothetical protein [Reichenbachiella ulvae]
MAPIRWLTETLRKLPDAKISHLEKLLPLRMQNNLLFLGTQDRRDTLHLL